MRNSTPLKKNLTLSFRYWKPFVGTAEQLSMKINDIEICTFGPRCIRIIESIFNHQFTSDEEIAFIASTFKVDKRNLYINDIYVTDFDYSRMWLINEAFAPVTHYCIHVDSSELKWIYSWSLDWHVQNLSARIEDVNDIKPEDLEKTLEELKAKYALQVTHNHYFGFTVVEYRTEEYNRWFRNDQVGCTPDNFDENIRKQVFKK